MKRIGWLVALSLGGSPAMAGGMPQTITYQGTLKQGGIPATGQHNMSFRLTDVSGTDTYGAVLNLSNVPINQGLFAVPLDFSNGGTKPVDWQAIQPYIEVSIDGQTLSPREPLSATAYALMSAGVADGAVTTAKVVDGAITTAKLADNAVTLSKLDPGTVQRSLIPPSTILPYGGSSAPPGFLLCDGSSVSRSIYADLFNVIGTTWGSGDGSTTFNLPDLRGRAPIGAGQGAGLTSRTLGQTLGEESHVLTVSEIPPHTHGVNDPGHTHSMEYGIAWDAGNSPHRPAYRDTNTNDATFSTDSAVTGISIQSTGGGQGHNSMQPSAVVNYIIKT